MANTKNKLVKKISEKNFISILKSRECENLSYIYFAEKFLIKERGYVFKEPKKGSNVILLFSGGIDSTVAWATLIEVYGYKVYPVIIDRGTNLRSKRELAAARSIEKFFQKKYPKLYVKPFHLSVNTVAKEVSDTLKLENLSSDEILNNYDKRNWMVRDDSNVVVSRTNGVSPYIMTFYGVVYSDYLKFIKGIDIKNIFVGVNFSDGASVSSQSFTSLRSTLLSICTATDNYDWNFSSVFLEKETGVMFEKTDVIELGLKLGLPLEKTWSCYHDKLFQCGDSCATCVHRRDSFSKLGFEDKTIYLNDLFPRLIGGLKHRLRGIF